MSFVFVPKSDTEIHEIQNRSLLPEGIYPFLVKDIVESTSSKGNAMLEILLSFIDTNGGERNIKDYLTATDQMIFKLKHFCDAIGLAEDYAKGSVITQKCIGRSGKASIGTQKGNAKPDGTGYYPDKNNVKDYIKTENVQNSILPDLNDPIPF